MPSPTILLADDDAEFGFVIDSLLSGGDGDGVTVTRQCVRWLQEQQRPVWNVGAHLVCVVSIVPTDTDDLRGITRWEDVDGLVLEAITLVCEVNVAVVVLAAADCAGRIAESNVFHERRVVAMGQKR